MRINPGKKLAARKIEGKLFIVDIAAETMHELSPSATLIWEAIAAGKSGKQIVEALCEEFSVAKLEAEADCAIFVEELKSKGLVVNI